MYSKETKARSNILNFLRIYLKYLYYALMQYSKATVSTIGETHPISTPSLTTLNNYKPPTALQSHGEASPFKDLFSAIVGPLPAEYFSEIHVFPLSAITIHTTLLWHYYL